MQVFGPDAGFNVFCCHGMKTMMPTLAESVILMSIYKPILFMLIFILWGNAVGIFDKDAERFFLKRQLWNAIQLGVGFVGFGLWLLMPFWIGFFVVPLILGIGVFAYVYYRNTQVEDRNKWTLEPGKFQEILAQKFETAKEEQAQAAASVKLLDEKDRPLTVPSGDDPNTPAHVMFEQIIDFAAPRGAERIDVMVDQAQASIAVFVDGLKYPQPNVEAKLGLLMVDYLKAQAKLDLTDRRKKQVGILKFEGTENVGKHKMQITTMGSTRGLSLQLEIDPGSARALPFEKLGLLDSQKGQLLPVLDQKGRAVLVVCPPGQGMTVSLYALAAKHDPYTQSITLLEDETLYDMEGVTHELIDPMDPTSLNNKLKALMLREAEVVMLARLADNQTAGMIADHADTTRFYFGIRAEDSVTALRMWSKAVGDQQKAANAIGAVMTQRLVRKLCTVCRVPFKPDPAVLRKLNLPPDKVSTLYKNSGQVLVKEKPTVCPDCMGLGFKGRTGVFELMAFDEQARTFMAAGQYDQLRAHLRKQKVLWLQEAALAKAVEGVTSIGEITRVMGGETAPAPAQQKA